MSGIYLEEWFLDGDRVGLIYSDTDIVYIKKSDWDRAFGPIVSACKSDVIRDYVKSS